MFQKIVSLSPDLYTSGIIEIEVDILSGMPFVNILGIGENAARGIRERIRSALQASGYELPARKITINLVSTEPLNSAEGLDLPIALGILCADRSLPVHKNSTAAVVGGLSLNGDIRPVQNVAGTLLRMQQTLQDHGIQELLLPAENIQEASLVGALPLIAVHTLEEAVQYWRGLIEIPAAQVSSVTPAAPSIRPLLSIRGQLPGKRALEVACAGYHNLLLAGPPGCGKTLLAQAIPALLPLPSAAEMGRILQFQSMTHTLDGHCLSRPVRRPHHSISTHALIGGGHPLMPGELTYADGGVLILDELAEFSRHVLENLRQPMESHQIDLHYLGTAKTFPADFMLAATMNLCPCGFFPDPERCRCSPSTVRRYHTRIGGPLLDRFDLCITLEPVPEGDTVVYTEEEARKLQTRIRQAAALQKERYKNETFDRNSRIPAEKIEQYCRLHPAAERVFRAGVIRMGLSLRAQHNILKAARSIADLAASDWIRQEHVAEALQYRPRGFFIT